MPKIKLCEDLTPISEFRLRTAELVAKVKKKSPPLDPDPARPWSGLGPPLSPSSMLCGTSSGITPYQKLRVPIDVPARFTTVALGWLLLRPITRAHRTSHWPFPFDFSLAFTSASRLHLTQFFGGAVDRP